MLRFKTGRIIRFACLLIAGAVYFAGPQCNNPDIHI